MRQVDLKHPRPAAGAEEQLARPTRHLDARLHDLDVGWPEVISADQQTGAIRVRFPGRDVQTVLDTLEHNSHIYADREGDCVLFRLSPDIPFEDLDYVWGALFELM